MWLHTIATSIVSEVSRLIQQLTSALLATLSTIISSYTYKATNHANSNKTIMKFNNNLAHNVLVVHVVHVCSLYVNDTLLL